jgi:hypothetical protein
VRSCAVRLAYTGHTARNPRGAASASCQNPIMFSSMDTQLWQTVGPGLHWSPVLTQQHDQGRAVVHWGQILTESRGLIAVQDIIGLGS